MISARLAQALFSTSGANVLCGVAYGQDLSTVTFPEWVDAATKFGRLALGEELIQSISCTVSEQQGRVEKVWVKLELAGYKPPTALFKELSQVLTERVGNRGVREGNLWRIWPFEGPPRGSVVLQHDGSRIHLSITPRAGESLPPA